MPHPRFIYVSPEVTPNVIISYVPEAPYQTAILHTSETDRLIRTSPPPTSFPTLI